MGRPELLRWDVDGPYEVFFSTRTGGVSDGPYESLNLGLLSGDEPARVDANRRLLFDAAGVAAERVRWPRQVHGGRAVRAGGAVKGADAIWTDEQARALLVVTADCLPVALVRSNGEQPAVALAHVGWRGLLAGILPAAVAALGGRLAAAIGPGIGPCCFDVREDVSAPVEAALGPGLVDAGRLDLPAAAERALRAAGVTRVDRLDECTACNPARYFSHRRDWGLTGRQGAIAYVT